MQDWGEGRWVINRKKWVINNAQLKSIVSPTVIYLSFIVFAFSYGKYNSEDFVNHSYFFQEMIKASLIIFTLLPFGFSVFWLMQYPKPALISSSIIILIIFLLWILYDEDHLYEKINLLILILGGLGAFYGLIIASRKQSKFEEQIDLTQKQTNYAQRQVFNDQLGRAVEMLANQDQTPIRMAGVRILQELGKSSNIKRKQLVKEILVDYTHEKATLDNPKPYPHKREIETAITAVATIGTSDRTTFKKLRLDSLTFENLSFSTFDFSSCTFVSAEFREINFTNCSFNECDLTNSLVNVCNFENIISFNVDLTHTLTAYNFYLSQDIINLAIYEENNEPSFIQNRNESALTLNIERQFIWREHFGRLYRHIGNEEEGYLVLEQGWNTKPLPQPSNQR